MIQIGSATKTIRLTHRYLGLFFAPAIVFFAFSGALQTFGLHEAARNGSYQPARWIVRIAQLHKKQTMQIPAPKNKSRVKATVPDPSADVTPKAAGENGRAKLALKSFVLVMSVALILTTVLGVVMAFRFGGNAGVVWAALLIGTLFPVAIAML